MQTRWHAWFLASFLLTLLTGCATSRIDWDARLGQYSRDDAIRELGPPDRSATLTDGSVVDDWRTSRGTTTATSFGGYARPGPYGRYGWVGPEVVVVDPPAPDRFLRLTFDPQGKLAAWQRAYR